MAKIEDIKKAIRDVPDFPKKGIIFKDITTILQDKDLFAGAIEIFTDRYRDKGIDKIVGIEARGFIFASAVAYTLGIGFVPVRKKGKLPYKTIEETYDLEYGTDTLQMHVDAVKKGEKVLLIDDLLATGGTANAVVNLIKKAGGKVIEVAFLIELSFLEGRKKFPEELSVFAGIVF